ncbi:N-acetylmuramoyl-L-alanine amidase family protein [Tumebacillus permanentifrigoris]|uniref:N-acetylmuramoyl-L-alanine amidase n=1 Tax=Tumebacillus permanentifrigoris TaxID=378543 RepID=A0A316D6R2_9BACL|nr:N-acetylmuramoyl-L-alanine amidase [Tumebacillus permanentifrigoris]PWK04999.1 N-acetylmuramoyl-L-alanine amidase [Tumebacillus permanentifrigoris]
MKLTRTLAAALVMTSILSVPAFAQKPGQTLIANEALSSAEPAPASFDPNSKNADVPQSIVIAANPIIAIDAGHGGSDPGGVGNGLYEKNLTLDIANRAKSYITTNYPASVVMTRSSDVDVSLASRTNIANNAGATFFVSMHINAFSDASANGLETWYYPGSTNGLNLATDVYNKLKASYTTLRGVKSADFYVLHYTNMPAALGETGFISNATDASKLNTTTFRQSLATQYSQGMHLYYWGN